MFGLRFLLGCVRSRSARRIAWATATATSCFVFERARRGKHCAAEVARWIVAESRGSGSPRRINGIGPWTATVILLRGLGRLDVFPMNEDALEMLGAECGVLYYYLLLGRLDARGDIGGVSRSFSD